MTNPYVPAILGGMQFMQRRKEWEDQERQRSALAATLEEALRQSQAMFPYKLEETEREATLAKLLQPGRQFAGLAGQMPPEQLLGSAPARGLYEQLTGYGQPGQDPRMIPGRDATMAYNPQFMQAAQAARPAGQAGEIASAEASARYPYAMGLQGLKGQQEMEQTRYRTDAMRDIAGMPQRPGSMDPATILQSAIGLMGDPVFALESELTQYFADPEKLTPTQANIIGRRIDAAQAQLESLTSLMSLLGDQASPILLSYASMLKTRIQAMRSELQRAGSAKPAKGGFMSNWEELFGTGGSDEWRLP